MENASKALIIAGAILLAILIISLGMMVLNNATGILGNGGMDKAAVQAFNETFLKYEGSRKGSEVRSLVAEVMSNNNSDEASDETYVTINNGGELGSKPVILDKPSSSDSSPSPKYNSSNENAFKNTKTYTVTCEYKNGRVNNIKIQ